VILENCDNPFLRRAVQSLGAQFHRYHELSRPGGYDADQAIPEHQHIVDAFIFGSGDKAAAAMEAHLSAVLERIQQA
jgi:DNA-binding FadR family transcriptional regulator